jgi:molybdenum cofactor cytidylyltransferase
LVVLGGYREDIEPKVRNFAVKRVVNENYREGMLSSVQSGLAALPGSARAAVFVLADQPGVPVRVIDSLIDAYHRVKKGIVLPVCREKRGHPLLIDLKYRREIEALPPDLGLRGLLREHPDDILEVPAPDLAVLVDIDTPDEYGRALEGTRRPRSRVRRV